jgi:hypothetical protein
MSSKTTTALDREVKKRLPSSSFTRWNFKSRMINAIFQTRASAMATTKHLRALTSVFLIKMFASVFQKSDSLFNIFQKKSVWREFLQTKNK